MPPGQEHCANCGEPTPAAFCASCGQRNVDYRRPLRELLSDAFGELFQLDSRIGRTLTPFLFRPGRLTNEFLAGRRTHYSSPMRLYLLTSVAYFLALSWLGPGQIETDSPVASTPAERRLAIEREAETFARFGELGVRLHTRLLALAELGEVELARDLGRAFLAQAPTAMFFLLPAFALLLEGLYLGSKRFYVEHLVFSLHFHAFAFVAQVPGMLLGRTLQQALNAATVAYLVVALRTVYRQSWPRTLWKSAALLAGYSVVLTLALLAMAVVAILAE